MGAKPRAQQRIWHAGVAVYKEFGVRGFYSSLGAKLGRSVWYSTVTLLFMDYMNALPEHMKMK
eukprot:NODE_10191_length_343_cov_16.704082_g9280_i0.p1 GENE.NODE_10191_length_343_cov_16.704082_g9280_i0~~NODE_10191_length_343_cov_16.704082_g9280_i0.p1  ORF type:complete len:72 (-),score=22.91 NODE_10191_length_343_cov_16.704082_g9280_i0:126-314(-)